MSDTKPGMPSPALNEDDVRRIAADVFREVMEEYYGSLADRLLAKFKALPQATDKEPADEGSRTPHATQEEVGVYSDVPPYT